MKISYYLAPFILFTAIRYGFLNVIVIIAMKFPDLHFKTLRNQSIAISTETRSTLFIQVYSSKLILIMIIIFTKWLTITPSCKA